MKTNKRKKSLLIVCCVLLVLAMSAAGVAVWQKNNLEAVKQYTQYTQEELEIQLQDNDQKVQDILNAALEEAKKVDSTQQATDVQVSQEPQEPQAPGVQPEPTVPQTSQIPQTPQTPTDPQEPVQPSETPSTPNTPKTETPPAAPQTTPTPESPTQSEESKQTDPTYEEQLQRIADKVYALRAEYLKALDDLQAEAVAEYKAIPKNKRTKKAIISFVSTYISKATTLEKQCDGKMDELIKELTQLQKKYGQSLELVDTVKYTYANEKSLKKAWYMSELERRGMI